MRHTACVVLLAAIAWGPRVYAQQGSARLAAGVKGGGTYYCIVSRCNTGTAAGILAELEVSRMLALELELSRHFCFDCDRFILADAAMVLRYPGRFIRPFAAAGVSRASDPGFMGTHTGLLGAVGAWAWFHESWGARLELRGRQVGRGDAMAELSLAVARGLDHK